MSEANHDMAPTILSLFSGYGGLELGLHAALGGGRTVGYVEREAYAASILLARMEEQTLEPAPVWCGNLEECDYSAFHGVGWITAGFPCQPFSTAGKRLGQADERWLWDDIVRILREVQPRWCLFENVPGLVRLGLGPVLRDLAVLGFDVEWGVFKASDVGASHKRERIFILAHRGHEPGCSQQQDSPESGGRDAQLADTCGESRLQVPQTGRADGAQGDDASGASGELADTRPVFAPGPADLDVWARVLAQAPQVEPSLCRMADGSAGWLEYRQDRLRALGNGVVPLQAAVAVRVLAERAGWGLDG